MEISEGVNGEIVEIMTENFPKLIRHQTTDPGNTENAKQNKYGKNLHLGILNLNCRIPKYA